MENVYKALLMAGAIMIGVFLLYNFTRSMDTTTEFTLSYSEKLENDRIRQYNSDFTEHTGIQLNMYEVVSLINKALYINENMEFDPNTTDYIEITLDSDIVFEVNGTTKKGTNDFIGEFYNGSTFDYDEFHNATFGLLAKYYDDTIDWKETTSVLEPKREDIPAYRMEITGYEDNLVSDVRFYSDGVFNPDTSEDIE